MKAVNTYVDQTFGPCQVTLDSVVSTHDEVDRKGTTYRWQVAMLSGACLANDTLNMIFPSVCRHAYYSQFRNILTVFKRQTDPLHVRSVP
jgi:hypothetical protein